MSRTVLSVVERGIVYASLRNEKFNIDLVPNQETSDAGDFSDIMQLVDLQINTHMKTYIVEAKIEIPYGALHRGVGDMTSDEVINSLITPSRWEMEFGWKGFNPGESLISPPTKLYLVKAVAVLNTRTFGFTVSMTLSSTYFFPIYDMTLGKMETLRELALNNRNSRDESTVSLEDLMQALVTDVNRLLVTDERYEDMKSFRLSMDEMLGTSYKVGDYSASRVYADVVQKPMRIAGTFLSILDRANDSERLYFWVNDIIIENGCVLVPTPYKPGFPFTLIVLPPSSEGHALEETSTTILSSANIAEGFVYTKVWTPAIQIRGRESSVIDVSLDILPAGESYAGYEAARNIALGNVDREEKIVDSQNEVYNAWYELFSRSTKKADITMIGSPYIRPSDIVELSFSYEPFDGMYLIFDVSHQISRGSFTTSFSCDRVLEKDTTIAGTERVNPVEDHDTAFT